MICEWFFVRGQIRLQKKAFFFDVHPEKVGCGGVE